MAKDATGIALSLLNNFAGSKIADQLKLRKSSEKLAYSATKHGFQAIALASRQFKALKNLTKPARLEAPAKESTNKLFDLSLTEEQQMMRDSLTKFSIEVIRPAAEEANETLAAPKQLLQQAQEFGLHLFAIPEELGGIAAEKSTVSNLLMTEDLAYGDMGIAVAILSTIGVINALSQWGDAAQQAKYLPAFIEENIPVATSAINEPMPLFNPQELKTIATPTATGYVLNGVKSAVPQLRNAEIILVSALIPGKGPAIFIIEANQQGVGAQDDHCMGVRAAEFGRLILNNVEVPANAKLGDHNFCYHTFINYAKLGWCGLAIGCGQAVLDYVIKYCNEREAFGEPISHRQAVAFMIANIEIELQSMRIVTLRACAKAENGLEFSREAYLASLLCSEKGMEIGTNGVQLLGGHGFTKEHPVERWYRDLRAVSILCNGMHL